MTDSIVHLKSVCYQHDNTSILSDIDLSMGKGEIVTLIGPNGAGKTTLVKLVLGLLQPSQGIVNRKKKLRIGYMPQHLHIDPTLPITVKRFLQLANPNQLAIKQVLQDVGIAELLNRPVQRVSGGEMQRVLLARALLRNPELLVLDEPAQGVDINGQNELYQMISTIRDKQGCAVLMVSHDLHLVMAQTDTVICLNHHVCCHGYPEQVSNDPAYRELFGAQQAAALAIYQHHHDHDHDIHGDVICDHKDGKHG